ncbi:S8 family serine peptidase [Alteromonas flava]|uniref:S8 family serine peptidase n=1 Tax=Alteromonas flava TaxID=2048003 RepID=UPI000C29055B|nr:S8 family serine peptidase [Alteromonas flava]
MNHKVTLAVSAALMSMSVHSATELANASQAGFNIDRSALKAASPKSINKGVSYTNFNFEEKFKIEKGLENKPYTYIVHFNNAPVALYDGGVEGLEATSPGASFELKGVKSNSSKLDVNSPEVVAYSSFLERNQNETLDAVTELASNAKLLARYKYALNAAAISLTPSEAEQVAKLPGVKFVERDQLFTLDTDTGPGLIGAPAVWDGSAPDNGVGVAGEGVVVGIIDSGINTDHDSFADISGDGYDHENPLGEGVYLGDCAGDFASLCNDKLIGVYSYPVITDNYDDTSVFPPNLPKNGEDYGGHGTHVASTAAGNILYDVPESTPEFGAVESSGVPTGFVFDRISGVAPRANIISYQVCFGGRSQAGDTYGDCPGAAIAAGIESAIADGVDVINYSISGGGFSWGSSTELAYLSARNAGIFVATSAGNGGPGASTTPKHAPWYTAVAAAEHGRSVEYAKSIGTFTGGDSDLADIDGVSNSGGITASIVYAGDYENPNSDDDPAQCLEPFPAGTFSGEIVVCDRGSIARVQKAVNVADGGAGGYVLANLQGGATSLNSDAYVIPGIHISADDGDALKAWLASGEGHTATIAASSGELVIDPSRVDVLAGFSSKGPSTTISTLTPTITGPGVNIYAAYADQQFGHDGHEPAAGDFDYLSGTSMSSPHVAGAAALVKSAKPNWSPDNIRSALAMTATPTVIKEDGVTPGDWFDMGSGRVQVDLAVQAGLVMDETAQNYVNANPNAGGEPRSLNIPSVTDTNCVGVCTWTRTVTATKDGNWTAAGGAISDGVVVSVSPETFTLAAGESQELEITVDVFNAESDVWSFGIVNLTSDSSPDLHLPVSVVASLGNIPDTLEMEAKRNQDSFLVTDLLSVEITDFTATSFGLTKATVVEGSVAQDSNNSSILDDLEDGLFITTVDVPEGAKRLFASTSDSTSPDLDLFVVIDRNADGIPTGDEVVGVSATASADELVDLMEPEAGFYWLIVQNWAASSEDAEDTFNLNYAMVDGEVGDNLMVDGPSTVPGLTPFEMRLTWDLADGAEGDMYFGAIELGTSADNAGNLGLIGVDLYRGQDDVYVISSQEDRAEPGDTVPFTVAVAPNFTPEDRDYQVSVTLPEGVSLVDGSTSAVVDGDTLTWMVSQPSLFGQEPTYRITTNDSDAMCASPFGGYLDLAALGINLDPSIDGNAQFPTYSLGFNYLGSPMTGFGVSDDGFITLDSNPGANPFVNQLLPDSEAPNGVMAPLWRNMQFNLAADSGLTVASNSSFIIVEWDNMETRWTSGGVPVGDKADFQVVITRAGGGGQIPDITYVYTDVVHGFGDIIPTTVGYESTTGTSGGTGLYSPYDFDSSKRIGSIVASVQDEFAVCMWLEDVPDDPTMLSFEVAVDADNAGGPIQMMAMSQVFKGGTEEAFPGTTSVATELFDDIQVEGPPVALIDGMVVADLSVVELTELDLPGTVTEPNGDEVEILWKQVSGPAAVIAGNGLAEAILMAPEVTEDSMVVLEMTATDSNGNSVTATANVMVMNNLPPEIAVSAPTSVVEGDTIRVTVSTTDNEGDAVTVTINGVEGTTYTTVAPATNSDTSVSFEVVATDGLNTTTEVVSVQVRNKKAGSMGWIALLLVPVVWLRRRKTTH